MKISLLFPFRGIYPISFGFGEVPTNPIVKEQYQRWGLVGHNGVDFALPVGTEVTAAANGRVIQTGSNDDFGISVTVEHIWGQSLYAHLQESKVLLNARVKSGETIGLSGQTGNTFGAHLHFAIRPRDFDPHNGYLGYIDPTAFFSKKRLVGRK